MRTYLLLCALLAASCDPSPACDPGQHVDTGSCLPDIPAASKDAGQDAASEDDAGGTSTTTADKCKSGPGNYTGFGAKCAADSDCSCIAPTCATPGLEYCSRLECQTDKDACPPGWTCTDIAALAMKPGVTHMCIKN